MNALKLPGDKRAHISEYQRRRALDTAVTRVKTEQSGRSVRESTDDKKKLEC